MSSIHSSYSFGRNSSISGAVRRSNSQSRSRSSFTSLSAHNYSSRPLASISSMGNRRGVSTRGIGGISSNVHSSSFSIMPGGCVVNNEKDTMQNLNKRLSLYLEKVQALEESNKELEKQIQEFASTRTIEGFDWSSYNAAVKPLHHQIISAILQNAQIALETDNAKLAAEDFKNKWQSELMLRQSVETDIDGLHQLKDTYVQVHANLTNDINGLEDEMAYLKKNHNEDLRDLRQQKTQDVQVEVDSVQGVDLAAVMKELRDKYTILTNNNQADMDKWYKEQLTIREMEISQNDQATVHLKTEITQLRRQYQNLEAERNGYCGNLAALENTLRSTEALYDSELQNYQAKMAQLEGELGNIRNELIHQNKEYQNLLNLKMKLEAEINQYKILLEGGHQGFNTSGSSSSKISQSSSVTTPGSAVRTTKVITDRLITRY